MKKNILSKRLLALALAGSLVMLPLSGMRGNGSNNFQWFLNIQNLDQRVTAYNNLDPQTKNGLINYLLDVDEEDLANYLLTSVPTKKTVVKRRRKPAPKPPKVDKTLKVFKKIEKNKLIPQGVIAFHILPFLYSQTKEGKKFRKEIREKLKGFDKKGDFFNQSVLRHWRDKCILKIYGWALAQSRRRVTKFIMDNKFKNVGFDFTNSFSHKEYPLVVTDGVMEDLCDPDYSKFLNNLVELDLSMPIEEDVNSRDLMYELNKDFFIVTKDAIKDEQRDIGCAARQAEKKFKKLFEQFLEELKEKELKEIEIKEYSEQFCKLKNDLQWKFGNVETAFVVNQKINYMAGVTAGISGNYKSRNGRTEPGYKLKQDNKEALKGIKEVRTIVEKFLDNEELEKESWYKYKSEDTREEDFRSQAESIARNIKRAMISIDEPKWGFQDKKERLLDKHITKYFIASHDKLTGCGLKYLGNCKNLKVLRLRHRRKLTGEFLKYLPDTLEVLDLEGCSNLDPEKLKHFKRFNNLKILGLKRYWKMNKEILFNCLPKNIVEVHVHTTVGSFSAQEKESLRRQFPKLEKIIFFQYDADAREILRVPVQIKNTITM